MVGGATWSRMASTLKMPSTTPAAPSRCPVIDLVPLTASLAACAPNAFFMAVVSATSPSGVEVACAFTCCTSSALMPASRRLFSIESRAPAPSSGGAVMWKASPLMPKPMSSA